MYTLTIKGTRRATLVVHRCESYADLLALLAIYHALGYSDDSLVVERLEEEQAA